MYSSGSYDKQSDFMKLNEELLLLEPNKNANRIFYLALPPSVFEIVAENISKTCIAKRSVLNFLEVLNKNSIPKDILVKSISFCTISIIRCKFSRFLILGGRGVCLEYYA